MKTMRMLVILNVCLIVVLVCSPKRIQAESAIVVDHLSVDLFDEIPEEYLEAARNLRMFFIDRSVGSNINDGLNCLAEESYESAPNHCKVAMSPEDYNPDPVLYDRSNWDFWSWPDSKIEPEMTCSVSTGEWWGKGACFDEFARNQAESYDVMSFQYSYLVLQDYPQYTIADLENGFFVDHAEKYDVYDYELLERDYPGKFIIYWTSSLARTIGTSNSDSFNQQMRDFAVSNNKILFDVADIESHDPDGNPCYDNRDGVTYEDDGFDYLAICDDYTSERNGGHLGRMATGKIRIAKAYWVLMAQIAGWNPYGPPENQAPVVDAGFDLTIYQPETDVTLAGVASDDGLPTGELTYSWSVVSGPGSVTFTDPFSLTTTASLDVVGVYTLRLTVDDSELTSFDDVIITLNEPPVNEPPFVDAGPDLNLHLPDTAQLNGTVADDGLPTNTITVNWSQVSGPGLVSFAYPTSAETEVSFDISGVYVLRLEAYDGEYMSYDEVQVEVLDPLPNESPVAENFDFSVDNNQQVEVVISFTDPDGPGPYEFSITKSPDHGSLTGEMPELIYTPDEGYVGIDSFNYVVNDGLNDSNEAVVTVQVQEPPATDPSLVSDWGFDDGIFTDDLNGCTGCLNHGATWTADGAFGGAFAFDGSDDYAELGDFPYIDSASSFTASVWVKPGFDQNFSSNRYVLTDGNNMQLFYLGPIHSWRASLRTTGSGVVRLDARNLQWEADSWHLLTLTFDGTVAALFWDGVEMDSKRAIGDVESDTGQAFLGAPTFPAYTFLGSLDELKIYSVALNPQDVVQLYSAR